MVTLKLIEAVRGSRLADAWHQIKLLGDAGGAASGTTDFTVSAVGFPGDAERDHQGTGSEHTIQTLPLTRGQ